MNMWTNGLYKENNKVDRNRFLSFLLHCALIFSVIIIITGCNENACFEEPGWDSWERIDLPEIKGTGYHFLSIAECPDGGLIVGSWGKVFKQVKDDNWEEYYITARTSAITQIVNNGEGLLFAAQNPGGVFVSENNGRNWRQVNNRLANIYVHDLAAVTAGYLFAATDGGVFVTQDNGESWSLYSDESIPDQVWSLKVDSEGILYAAAGNSVFKTEVNAQNWSEMDNGLIRKRINDLAISSDGSILAAANDGIICKFNKGNDTWVDVSPPMANRNIDAIAISGDGVIYAAEYKMGILISHDDCLTWERSTYGISDCSVYSLYARNGAVLACSRNILKSDDEGKSWRIITWEFGEDEAYMWKCIQAAGDGSILAGNNKYGLFITDDSGKSWIEIWNHKYTEDVKCWDEKVYCVASSILGIFDIATESIRTMMVIESDCNNLEYVEVDSRGRIYTGNTKEGIYRSENGGENWSNLHVTFQEEYGRYRHFEIEVKEDSIIFVSASMDIYRSMDDGVSWEQLDISGFSLEVAPGGIVYMCGPEGVFTSDDNGDNWELIEDSPMGNCRLAISGEGHILLSCNAYLFHSLDGGKSWYRDHYINYQTVSSSITDMAFGPEGHAYVMGYHNIFRSPRANY